MTKTLLAVLVVSLVWSVTPCLAGPGPDAQPAAGPTPVPGGSGDDADGREPSTGREIPQTSVAGQPRSLATDRNDPEGPSWVNVITFFQRSCELLNQTGCQVSLPISSATRY